MSYTESGSNKIQLSAIILLLLHKIVVKIMILSMTGYGKASAEYQGKKITAEIRSLNSKALDLSTRLAPAYREKEMEIRGMIAQALERGKVEFNLWIEQTEGPAELPINAVLAEAYHRQIQGICQQYGIPEPADWMPCLLRMPDVMARTQEVAELTAEEWNAAKQAIAQAIGQLMAMTCRQPMIRRSLST